MTDKNSDQHTGGGPGAIEAMAFFKLSGRQESYKAGTCIFPEARRLRPVAPTDARIYLLVSGAVTLTRYGKPISLIMPGEIFAATSVILPSSRFTTAKAHKDCAVLGLEPKQFLHDLQKNPTFILTLLNDLARRLQSVMARVVKLDRHSAQPPVSIGLNADQIERLAEQLGDPMPARSEAGGKVISEGAHAIYMYVLKEGRVDIMVGNRVVEIVQTGAVFGEMALVGMTRRTAMAIAVSSSAWYSMDSKQLVAVTKSDAALGLALLRSLTKRLQHASQLLCESSSDLAALHLPRLNSDLTEIGRGLTKRSRQGDLSEYKSSIRAFIEQSAEIMAGLAKALAAADKFGAQFQANALKAAAARIGAERLCFQADTLCTALSVGHADIIEEVLVAVRSEHQDTCDEIRDYVGAAQSG